MEFVVLPDQPLLPDQIERISQTVGDCAVPHGSGRPWIIGRWSPSDLTTVRAGDRRLVVFGRTRIQEQDLARELGRLHAPQGLDTLARRMPGAVHLLLSMDGVTRSQGCVSTVRQVFHTTVGGSTVAASAIGPLRALTGAAVDLRSLALRLLSPMGAPWPLSAETFWAGIRPVPSGHWLEIDGAGRGRTHRWWEPPGSSRSRADAARAVRAALAEAISVRVRDRGRVSTDLSGGLDSTSLSFIAAAEGADLVTFHVQPLDPGNTDTLWARRAAEAIPLATHRVIPGDRPANLFQVDIEQGSDAGQWEGPQLWIGGWAHLSDLAGRIEADRSNFHMMGFGGDTLFGAMPAYLWSLSRRHPLRSLPVIRRSRLLNRWSWWSCVRGLSDRSTFPQSLAAIAEAVEGPPPRPPHLDLGWVPPARIPPWATAQTADLVRRALRDAAADGPRPLDADRTRHQTLEAVLFEGSLVRQIRAATNGPVEWDAPMLDHRVIEAAMSVRMGDRLSPGRYKPLLTAAMRGIVPDAILDRPDKGEFSAEMHEGLRRNQRLLLELCDGSRLAELGLIDAAALRARLRNPGPLAHHLTILQNTLACEGWLRSSAVASTGPTAKMGAAR